MEGQLRTGAVVEAVGGWGSVGGCSRCRSCLRCEELPQWQLHTSCLPRRVAVEGAGSIQPVLGLLRAARALGGWMRGGCGVGGSYCRRSSLDCDGPCSFQFSGCPVGRHIIAPFCSP